MSAPELAPQPLGEPAARPRAEDRRRLIARMAVEVLGREGSRGFNHRAIDRALALPLGTTSAYYRRRADLVLAAFSTLLDEDMVLLAEHFDPLLAQGGTLEIASVAARLQRFTAAMGRRGGAHDLARVECYLLAQRQPGLREPLARMTARREGYLVHVFARLGSDHPAHAAALFDMMVRGMFYQRSLLAGLVPAAQPQAGEFADMLDLALRRAAREARR